MASVVPFLDLNLFPDPPAATGATSSAGLLIPKLEPKVEPLDEPTPAQTQPHQPNSSSPNPRLCFNSLPDSFFSELNSNSADSVQGTDNSPDGKNVYSEFHRISELFRTAFAKPMQKQERVEVAVPDPDSKAIVPVPDENTTSAAVVPARRKCKPRSSELVRVMNMGADDHRYFRDVVRKTRMVYNSLRVFAVAEEEKRFGRRCRADLKAAAVMKERGLWLNRDRRIVGSIPGVFVGDLFFFRMELCVVGLHGQAQAGIDYLGATHSSNGEPIATSIIVSGGYEDDDDQGDVLIYTGHGGQDKNSRQCVHQKLEGGNLALERSMHYGIEVRVIRGFKYQGSASGKVYVYDGLYRVIDSWFDVGKSGFGVYKYKLIRIENQPLMGSVTLKFALTLRTTPLSVRPLGYASLDISMKKENIPVFLFNDIDANHEPMYYQYIVTAIFPPFAYHEENKGCDCVAGCMDDCPCARKNGGEFAYDQNGILVRGKPVIFECGTHCRCLASCRNRVSQKGVRNRLEVFRSNETGWGVRSLDLIQAGAFICEYAGVVLTKEQAQIFAMNGDSLVYPSRFAETERWAEWGDLSPIFTDYVRPAYPSIPSLGFAMDVSRMRNVACYMSHSSSPNVMVQFVLYDHNNLLYPHLMLFAMENIPPLRELSLDYGMADEWTGKLRICA
ncbi:histone-lysine N-methyltransferase family member SUVH9 [Diospyros lotus]|uniref:histone-lysine N-methyltransferase family member SUVH9 n=1 Tax=Diospyros lotus TaxID=55363 RepID=UPI0022550E38|nr:histone-lysine N-methyltransferase family member SUVH9 [Diospyros lotus]XP_052190981.1 histone-lysine N-methyltransferase family member SUVH9 [Diospyros lotus]XP_052190982.1 histone-lysine N-methyltransferase family member SUVH9 [Diospyros lotus]XP_052190983.1 histone-lysine N-methyltransferase family member SUVH9 [Diospyros lotus]